MASEAKKIVKLEVTLTLPATREEFVADMEQALEILRRDLLKAIDAIEESEKGHYE